MRPGLLQKVTNFHADHKNNSHILSEKEIFESELLPPDHSQ